MPETDDGSDHSETAVLPTAQQQPNSSYLSEGDQPSELSAIAAEPGDDSAAHLPDADEEEEEGASLLPGAAAPPAPPAAAAAAATTAAAAAAAAASARSAARVALGVACIVAVAAIWVLAGELAQYLFTQLAFSEPILLTYINVSEFALLLPLAALREALPAGAALAAPRSDWRGAARAALLVCPLWFFAQGAYNMSLVTTSVSSSTALSSTSCVFTFLLTLCVRGGAGGSWLTAGGVAATLVGAVLVGVGDDSGSGGSGAAAAASWQGDALALLSAAAYAGYSLAIKLCVPEDKEEEATQQQQQQGEGGRAPAAPRPPGISIAVFFGWLGVLTSLLLLPVVGALHATGVEDLSGLLAKPHLPTIVALVLLKGLFDNVLSDLLWARAIQLTSPTLASVGLSLTIPMAVLSDLAVRGLVPRAQGAAGAACIFVGFLCSVLGERRQLAKA